MACFACKNFKGKFEFPRHKEGVSGYDGGPGWCTLNPLSVDVTGYHWCGQFSAEKPESIVNWFAGAREVRKEAEAERRKRIDAEKALKEVRRKLRELKRAG